MSVLPDLNAKPLFEEQNWLYTTPKASSNFFNGTALENVINLEQTINNDGDFINDVINARLDTSSKYILSDFTFGATDYSGGIKTGDIAWNTSTGAVTGGSGVVVSRAGILGANAGVATFTIDVSGNATFAGTLAAAAGTLGAITIGSNAWHVDSSGNMWWGNHATYAAASIKISSAGSVNLTTGTFSGALSAATGSFAGTLSATSGTLGSITAGTITGATLQTTSSGAGWHVTMTDMNYYNGSAYPFSVVFTDASPLGDAGDVRIGNGSKYVSWDNSAGALAIRGTLNCDDLIAGTITGRTLQTAAPAGGVGSSVVITGGAGQNISFYYDATLRGHIRGYTTEGAEVTYVEIAAQSGRKLKLKNSFISCNGNFVSATDNTDTIGTDGTRWKFGYFKDLHVSQAYTGDIYVATSSGGSPTKKLDVEGGIVYDR